MFGKEQHSLLLKISFLKELTLFMKIILQGFYLFVFVFLLLLKVFDPYEESNSVL